MPRVSQSHLDARRRQILVAARRCFITNGFHATSMQDILREADLSAGAVYRYFQGKDDIVMAIATDALDELTSAFDEALGGETARPLDEALDQMLGAIHRLSDTQDIARLILTVWGEGVRSPDLAAFFNTTFHAVRQLVSRAVIQRQERGLLPSDVSADGIARVLIGALHGYVIQNALLDDPDPESIRSGMHMFIGNAVRSSAASRTSVPRP